LFLLRDNTLTLIEDSQNVRNPFANVAHMFYEGIAVSGDGDILAINREFVCDEVGLLCRGLTTTGSTLIQTPTQTLQFDAWADLTANGHFAALSFLINPFLNSPYTPIRLFDFGTGNLGPEIVHPLWGDSFSHTVSEDGTVIGGTGSALDPLHLVGPSQSGPLHFASSPSRATLAGDASRIVYEVVGPAPGYQSFIHVLVVKTGTDRLIGPGTLATLAQDGRRFSYLRTDNGSTDNLQRNLQVWLGQADSGFTSRLSSVPEGIGFRSQTITGDGRAVIAATNTGRLLSIDTLTGAVIQRLTLEVGFTGFLSPSFVSGSYNEVLGPFPNGDPEILIGGTPAFALGLTPRGYAFQIPWDAPRGIQMIVRESGSPWEYGYNVTDFSPVVLPVGQIGPDPVAYAIHQDWSGPVSHQSPARPGEIIHFYGSGWGPVDGTVASGTPTPSDRLYRITNSCDWRATGPDTGSPVYTNFDALFVGLAPGLVGVYQLDFRIPPDWKDSIFNPYCKWTSGNQAMFKTAPVDVQP
jgi:uncharacterized protein (TIGR03437 family)